VSTENQVGRPANKHRLLGKEHLSGGNYFKLYLRCHLES